jgi:hypothetical protein
MMIRYFPMKVIWMFLCSALICIQLIGCENQNPPVPGDINGPGVVYGPVENITRTGSLNIGKDESDGYYAYGEFVSGNEAYYVVLTRKVLIKAGIEFDKEGRYLGTHTVVISNQHKVTLEPGHPDIYEIRSIKIP